MTTENTARQPKGVPVGGQFAAATHSEPDLSLLKLTSQRDQMRAGLAEAAEKHAALEHAEWAQSVWEKYPHASFDDVHLEGDGNDGRFTAGIDLYDPEGIQIAVDGFDEAILEEKWDTSWDVSAHTGDARVEAVMPPYSNAFSLDSIKERWTKVSTSPEPSNDPFAHLSGMDRARAQSAYAQQINAEATDAYVKDLSTKLLAINPEFGRLYVNRNADVESGLTFNLDHVEDIHGNYGDVDLMALEDHGFQDIHLDGHVDYDEKTDRLYISINPGD